MKQPILETERLILRPFSMNDAKDVQRLAGAKEIASKTTVIPHPYLDGMAEEWIGTHNEAFEKGENANFAIVHKQEKYLIGCVGLIFNKEYELAEIGYWIGVDYWGNGYCSEAGKRIIKYGFNDLNLNRLQAYHFGNNPASGEVMKKIGMKYEGCQKQGIKKWGNFLDKVMYGILKSDFTPPVSG